MISKTFRSLNIRRLTKSIANMIVSHRLNYGQGGYCQFDLMKRNYRIQFQTIWEDHCLVEIEGAQGQNSLSLLQQGNKTIIHDKWLQTKDDQQDKVNIKFKIPEDFTYNGKINGSIAHTKSNVSNKLRCNQTSISLLGKNRVFQWGTLQTPMINLQVLGGAIDIKSLTFQNAKFNCNSFASSKVSFTDYLVKIRSVVAFGNAKTKIDSKFVQIQSISGQFEIQGDQINIDRVWGSPQGINIKAKKIKKIGIQTGTGTIQASQPIPQNAISFGKLHKGKIIKVSDHKILIQ